LDEVSADAAPVASEALDLAAVSLALGVDSGGGEPWHPIMQNDVTTVMLANESERYIRHSLSYEAQQTYPQFGPPVKQNDKIFAILG
jgi:hypothetical protein